MHWKKLFKTTVFSFSVCFIICVFLSVIIVGGKINADVIAGDPRSWYEYTGTWLFLFFTLGISFFAAAVIQKMSKDIFEAEERIKLMLDTSPLCCQIIAENFNTIDCNEAAVKLYGYKSKQEYVQKWHKECMPEYQPNGRLTLDLVWEFGLEAIKTGKKVFETMHQMPDGTPLPVEVSLVGGKYKGNDVIVAYTRDLRDIKELEIKVEEIFYDSLTGIHNRRYFDENLERIIKFSSHNNETLSMLMIDIDFFKNYNDTYGHNEGDNCLKIIALALSAVMSREGDFVARYGGEEFAVVLPHTSENGAKTVANKLLEGVRKLNIPHEKSDAANYVTISIGATTVSVHYNLKAEDCIKIADKALYMSKQNGRNQYTYLKLENSIII